MTRKYKTQCAIKQFLVLAKVYKVMKMIKFEIISRKRFLEHLQKVKYIALRFKRNLKRAIQRFGVSYDHRIKRTIKNCVTIIGQPPINSSFNLQARVNLLEFLSLSR